MSDQEFPTPAGSAGVASRTALLIAAAVAVVLLALWVARQFLALPLGVLGYRGDVVGDLVSTVPAVLVFSAGVLLSFAVIARLDASSTVAAVVLRSLVATAVGAAAVLVLTLIEWALQPSVPAPPGIFELEVGGGPVAAIERALALGLAWFPAVGLVAVCFWIRVRSADPVPVGASGRMRWALLAAAVATALVAAPAVPSHVATAFEGGLSGSRWVAFELLSPVAFGAVVFASLAFVIRVHSAASLRERLVGASLASLLGAVGLFAVNVAMRAVSGLGVVPNIDAALEFGLFPIVQALSMAIAAIPAVALAVLLLSYGSRIAVRPA